MFRQGWSTHRNQWDPEQGFRRWTSVKQSPIDPGIRSDSHSIDFIEISSPQSSSCKSAIKFMSLWEVLIPMLESNMPSSWVILNYWDLCFNYWDLVLVEGSKVRLCFDRRVRQREMMSRGICWEVGRRMNGGFTHVNDDPFISGQFSQINPGGRRVGSFTACDY